MPLGNSFVWCWQSGRTLYHSYVLYIFLNGQVIECTVGEEMINTFMTKQDDWGILDHFMEFHCGEHNSKYCSFVATPCKWEVTLKNPQCLFNQECKNGPYNVGLGNISILFWYGDIRYLWIYILWEFAHLNMIYSKCFPSFNHLSPILYFFFLLFFFQTFPKIA